MTPAQQRTSRATLAGLAALDDYAEPLDAGDRCELGGSFVAIGAAMVVAGLTRSATVFAVVLVILLATILLVTVYSYVVWRGDPQKHPLGR